MKRIARLCLALSLLAPLAGCGGEESQDPPTNNADINNGGDTNNDQNNGDANNGQNNGQNNGGANNGDANNGVNNGEQGPYSGSYQVGLAVAPLSGLVLPFQVDIDSQMEGDALVFKTLTLRASKDSGEVSEVLSTAMDVAVEGGAFAVDFGTFTMPGAFTPTGSDVDVEVMLQGQLQEEGLFCGDVTGEIVTFGFDLAGSTFGAVPVGSGLDPRSSCQGGGGEGLPRLEAAACPELSAGMITGFPSAGRERNFELIAPEGAGEQEALPLLFVFHGIGGSPAGILNGSGLREMAQEMGFVLVAPAGFEIDGAATWNVVSPENEDVAFFDDMLTCLGESFPVDTDRIYVTGHSNGGLFASNLLRLRSEQLAAAAPNSGGWFAQLESANHKLPVLVNWGGSADMAFDQDFNRLSLELIEGLRADGHFVVACDHGQGHALPQSTWPWLVEFLLAHSLQSEASPLADGLPESFPDYCLISP